MRADLLGMGLNPTFGAIARQFGLVTQQAVEHVLDMQSDVQVVVIRRAIAASKVPQWIRQARQPPCRPLHRFAAEQ